MYIYIYIYIYISIPVLILLSMFVKSASACQLLCLSTAHSRLSGMESLGLSVPAMFHKAEISGNVWSRCKGWS